MDDEFLCFSLTGSRKLFICFGVLMAFLATHPLIFIILEI